jgi:hypothetical protein
LKLTDCLFHKFVILIFLATLSYNWPIHGICFDSPNLHISSDIMGAISDSLEATLGGGAVALFVNGAEGDVNPVFPAVCVDPSGKVDLHGGPIIAERLAAFRNATETFAEAQIAHAAHDVVLNGGLTDVNLTIARVSNCTEGGPLDICTICRILDCGVDAKLGPGWVRVSKKKKKQQKKQQQKKKSASSTHILNLPNQIIYVSHNMSTPAPPPQVETSARFNAAVLTLGGQRWPLVTVPGEALTAVGWAIRNDTALLGFNGTETFLFGLTNSHIGYIAGSTDLDGQYQQGGYEALLTFFGAGTADMIRQAVGSALKAAVDF